MNRTMTPTDQDGIRKDLALLAQQQLELDQRLREIERVKPITGAQLDKRLMVVFEVVRDALKTRTEEKAAAHDSVHKQAIRDVRENALLAGELGKSTFNEACDALKQAVEQILATGATKP